MIEECVMAYDFEMLQSIGAIYKYAFENPNTHRNTMRKYLLSKGKVSSKEKFSKALEGLIALGRLSIDKENISINPSIVDVGVLQKDNNDFYVVTPNSKKHFKVSKGIAQGYKTGDLLEIVIENNGKSEQVFVLGKSQREFEKRKNPSKQPTEYQVQNMMPSENLLLGRVVKLSHDELVFIPNKKSIPVRQIPILNNKEEMVKFQDKICIMNLMNMDVPLLGGHIVEVKGDAGNPVHEYDAIAESYGAIMNWSGNQISSEIEKIPSTVDVSKLDLIPESQAKTMQRGHVVDLRNIPFVTVDPATCKDMDDAIYSTFDENGDIVCYTAVANVTKYVDLNSEIGSRYVNGGFTIYAPNKAYNISPTKLSTGICSLNPNEDRLAFVVKTVMDKSTGKVKSSNIYDAIIQSRQKYSYEQAQEVVDLLDQEGAKEYLQYKVAQGEEFTPEEQLLMNYYAGQTIKVGFEQRKMIRFVSNKEREIVFDSDLQDVVDISIIPHLYYHEVIEAFMVTANEATAKYARDNNLDNVFRVHDEPNPRKLDRANEFFNILGIDFDGDLSAQGTRALIEVIRNTTNEEVTFYSYPTTFTSNGNYKVTIIPYALEGYQGGELAEYAVYLEYINSFNGTIECISLKDYSKDYSEYTIDISNVLDKYSSNEVENASIKFKISPSVSHDFSYVMFKQILFDADESSSNYDNLINDISIVDANKSLLLGLNIYGEKPIGYWSGSANKTIHWVEVTKCSFTYDTYERPYGNTTKEYAFSDLEVLRKKGYCDYDVLSDGTLDISSFNVLNKEKCPILKINEVTYMTTAHKRVKTVTCEVNGYLSYTHGTDNPVYSQPPKFILGTDQRGFDIFTVLLNQIIVTLIIILVILNIIYILLILIRKIIYICKGFGYLIKKNNA
jgi:exoribonuclease R